MHQTSTIKDLEMNRKRIGPMTTAPSILMLLLSQTVLGWSATRGPDAFGYIGTDAAVYSFVDISGAGGGTSILAGVDDGAVALTLPFNFRYYGTNYKIICASSNGAVYFVTGANVCNSIKDFSNVDLTSASPAPDLPALLPFWTDLTFQNPGAGSVFYQAVGTPGSRRFVIQWNNAYPQGDSKGVTFEVLLAEVTNTITFQYQTAALGGGDRNTSGALATVGIHNAGGQASGQQLEWSYASPVLSNGSVLTFQISTASGAPGPCDLNQNGVLNVTDVQLVVNEALGSAAAVDDLNGDGAVNVVDIQIEGDSVIGLGCEGKFKQTRVLATRPRE